MRVKPFIKWAGGKASLIDSLLVNLPISLEQGKIDTYVEPFLGGGALFFEICQRFSIRRYLLNDSNESLINAYKVIRNRPKALLNILIELQNEYCALEKRKREEYYYNKRNTYNELRTNTKNNNLVEESALLIFLNKTCYNGLFRLNREGRFNVPYGRMPKPLFFDEENIRDASSVLKKAELCSLDFKEFLGFFSDTNYKNTLFYMDPPYTVKHGNNGFLEYNEKIFSWEDQIALACICNSLCLRGAQSIVSNANNPDLVDLYSNLGFHHRELTRKSLIGGKGAARESVSELVFMSYEVKDGRGKEWFK